MNDPIQAAKEAEQQVPFIAVQKFWKDYDPQPDGSLKEVEWVLWVKKGTMNPSTNEEKISRLKKSPDNPIWQAIKPYYEKWVAGETDPVNGTTLEAWPGITRELIEALKPVNIRTVEDFVQMEDSAIQRLGVPDLRKRKEYARQWLAARQATADVTHKNEVLEKKVEELTQALAALAAEKGIEIVDAPVKPRRGRPPKEKVAA